MSEPQDTTKRCAKCGKEKPLDQFCRMRAAKDGKFSRCRSCAKEDKAAYRAANGEKIKTYAASYRAANREKRAVGNRVWRAKNRDKIKTYRKAYYASYYKANREKIIAQAKAWHEANRKESAAIKRRYAARYPLRTKARAATSSAIRAAKLTPQPCEVCGLEPKKINGRISVEAHHHRGYSPEHWLSVQWLCARCHAAAHRRSRIESL